MIRTVAVKSILNKTKNRDPWFLDDYTVNPYSGCSFNCQYCYIRGSKYGINMEEKLSVKSNAVELLERQLSARARKKQYGIIVLSSATDPYLQIEKTEQLTRRLLEVILHYRFPVHIITKSTLVSRDFELLLDINNAAILPDDLQDKLSHRAFVTFSFSTIHDVIAHIFEPGAPAPSQRLDTLRMAIEKGLHSGVSLMPLLPFITDTAAHLEEMFQAFKTAGAAYIFPATLTLFGSGPSDSKTLVLNAVAKHYPHLLEKYHRFFADGSQMPSYYRQAFTQKMDELCRQYQIRNSLLAR
ncbi:radical SAM protein [Chitinophaga sp. G-6-1-13]|uniref:Radical SAM protein n=1 Tax=Chitinophaga fulva TaxID=2728842 RepID=A0A848GS46_9BACT|nr:radical SAM protein [Chitinophaga fulva]NML40331.1 radical SAM protein [Chitinophaga fulva]